MKVSIKLIDQLTTRFFENIVAERRTEALLLGEPYRHPRGVLGQLLPRPKLNNLAEAFADSARFAMMYGTALHSTMFKPGGTVTGRAHALPQIQDFRESVNRISCRSPDLCILDETIDPDFSKLEEEVRNSLVMLGRSNPKAHLMTGIHDEIFMDFEREAVPEQGALARAEPNRGPQPRKPHIHRRK
jgi:hypothetical protein